jgi:hypothetical protein
MRTRKKLLNNDRGLDLAQSWLHVVDLARHSSDGLSGRVPLCRDRVIAAEADIADLVNLLTDHGRASACATEVAEALLVDGTGPLYNRRSQSDLGGRIREALRTAA